LAEFEGDSVHCELEPKLNAYRNQLNRELRGAILVTDLMHKRSLPMFELDSSDFVLLTYHRHCEFVG